MDHKKTSKLNPGTLGEDFVATWLEEQGWEILHQRWRCRWGELDIIARGTEPHSQSGCSLPDLILIFVEVKTRSRGNWDANGLLAITPQKQTKLLQAAQVFLSQYSEYSHYPCRFDVALVQYYPKAKTNPVPNVALGISPSISSEQLVLQDYIPSAFDASGISQGSYN